MFVGWRLVLVPYGVRFPVVAEGSAGGGSRGGFDVCGGKGRWLLRWGLVFVVELWWCVWHGAGGGRVHGVAETGGSGLLCCDSPLLPHGCGLCPAVAGRWW